MFAFLTRLLPLSQKRLKAVALEGVFEDSRNARMITDINGEIVTVNGRMKTLCVPECSGRMTLNCVRGFFDDTELFDKIRASGEAGHSDMADLKYTQDGRSKWFTATVMPVPNIAGLLHWRFDDVTSRKSLESLIREEREKLLDFTDQAPLGFYTVTGTGEFTYMNATLARWLQHDGKSLADTKLHSIFKSVPAGIPVSELPEEGRLIAADGTERTVTVIQHREMLDDEVAAVRGIIIDTTDERRMARQLRESEDRFKIFFDEAPLGVALVDRSGALLDVNPMLDDLIDPTRTIADGSRMDTMVTDPESKEKIEAFLNDLQSGTVSSKPIEIVLDGYEGPLPMQMFARILPGQEQAVLHFIDLSEQKRLEHQFVQSQKMQAVGQLAGGVAHDFNNLLTAMIGYCDLLLLRHKPSDPSFADVMQIKQNANRAANLVRQLLAFSRQQTLQPKVLDPSEVMTELSHLLRRLLGPNVELKFIHDPELGLVKADQGQLEQVMINLVVNARDAMDSSGKLTISMKPVTTTKAITLGGDVQPPGEWVTITVSDTGTGMTPEIQQRIFDPFFTTKAVGAGTGLGLATVYGIVRQTGGYIHVNSTLGVGTDFVLYLPRIKEKEEAAVEAAPVETVSDLTGAAHIVLVEDEDAVRSFSKRALGNKGYEVTDFADGMQAFEWFEEQDAAPDLLITDVIMPELDGPTLAKKVREKFPTLKIIFVSGYTEDKFKKELGEDVFFLPKPFSLQQLAVKVKEVLS